MTEVYHYRDINISTVSVTEIPFHFVWEYFNVVLYTKASDVITED